MGILQQSSMLERSMCGAVTLSNGGEQEELNDSSNEKSANKKNQGCPNTVFMFISKEIEKFSTVLIPDPTFKSSFSFNY